MHSVVFDSVWVTDPKHRKILWVPQDLFLDAGRHARRNLKGPGVVLRGKNGLITVLNFSKADVKMRDDSSMWATWTVVGAGTDWIEELRQRAVENKSLLPASDMSLSDNLILSDSPDS